MQYSTQEKSNKFYEKSVGVLDCGRAVSGIKPLIRKFFNKLLTFTSKFEGCWIQCPHNKNQLHSYVLTT